MSRNTREHNADDLRISLIDFSSRRHSLIEGVLLVVAEAVEHVKMSLILPKMLDNPDTLIKKVRGTRFEPALKLVSDFLKRREIILKDHRPPLMDHGMIRIIDYFHNHIEMFKLVQSYMHDVSHADRVLVTTFEMLLKTATSHLNREANLQINEERRLFKLYKESKSLTKSIDRLKSKIASYQTTVRWKNAAKAAYLDKLERDISEKQNQLEKKIANEAELTDRITRNYKKISLEKQVQIEQEIEKAKVMCVQQIKDNKKHEKSNRDEKNKYLLQLESIIKKYDSVMKEKLTENLELEEQLEKAENKLAEFMITYKTEEKLYHEIVLKRELNEERLKKAKIVKYMMNRAARIIQKYWRVWKKEQKEKEKNKKRRKRPANKKK